MPDRRLAVGDPDFLFMAHTVLIRGSGDIASAVAHVLFTDGYRVVIQESPQPATTRRKMAFTDAVFDGSAELEGVTAMLCDDIAECVIPPASSKTILLTVQDFISVLATLRPDVLVDARMRKHDQPDAQITLAPCTIGLGPNFVAGVTVHVAVETGWNDNLGKVVREGSTRPLEGEPQTIAGHARDRYVYAPAAGVFRTTFRIGDMVAAGRVVATLDDIPLHAPIDGVLRGLTRDGVPVARKAKIIEVDPRGEQAMISGIAERPARIARGVLEAVRTWESGLSSVFPDLE
jgi:xanthine dehydrogenase accessory factor